MYHRLTYVLGAGAAALIAAATPALAQGEAAGPSAERIRQVIVYGNDPCPASTGGEITVCARQDEKERYRIPKELRDNPDLGSTRNEAWANRVKSIEYVGKSGTESCTPDGAGGVTGCFTRLAAQAKAERRMNGDRSWSDLVAAEREKRLSTIDADSEKIEEQVKAEEAARARATQEGLEDKGAPVTTPSADVAPDHRH